jgi:hypothetical protein
MCVLRDTQDDDTHSRDELYRALLVGCFLLQTMSSYLIPVIGPFLSFIHLSWLYALYCFEYKWSLHGWSLEKRLAFMEQHWYNATKAYLDSLLTTSTSYRSMTICTIIGPILQGLAVPSPWPLFSSLISSAKAFSHFYSPW